MRCGEVTALVSHIAIAKIISKKNNDVWCCRVCFSSKAAKDNRDENGVGEVHDVFGGVGGRVVIRSHVQIVKKFSKGQLHQ